MMQIALERPVTVAHASVSTEINEAVSPSSFSITDTESSDGDSDTEGDETVPLASSERPTNWLTGSYSGLCKVVARAEGAASNQVVSYIKKYMRGTKLLFVVGQSGTGKTTLLSELTGQDLPVNNTHKSGTKAHCVYPAIIEGDQYIFVDTAGFGAADIDDMENFHDIITCLDALAPFVTVAGLLFVYGGNQARMMQPDMATIQWVKCFCGPEFFQQITFVTTKWDTLDPDTFEECWEESLPILLEEQCLKELLKPEPTFSHRYHGAHLYHHAIKGGQGSKLAADTQRLSRRHMSAERAQTVEAMVHDRYRNPLNVKLQALQETASGIPWYKTEAAKVLKSKATFIDLHVEDTFFRVSRREVSTLEKARAQELAAASGKPLQGTILWKEEGADTTEGRDSDEEPFMPQKSWFETLQPWVETAKELAVWFVNERMNRANATRKAWSDYWGSFRGWWSGTTPS